MNKVKILLAEDSATILEIIKSQLQRLNYEVITAMDGKEALTKAAETKPDLILMDIVMPDMDGIEATTRLKRDENLKTIPILMLTAQDEESNVQKSINAGADDYIIKPVNPAMLRQKINKSLKK
ncbi:PleD family two-component system response regulator [Candidatus Margulisiibacteriota bacterium]